MKAEKMSMGDKVCMIEKYILLIFAIGCLCFAIFAFIDIEIVMGSQEVIVVEGEVINVDVYNDYLDITFDNGETYKVKYPSGWGTKSIDLTVNSKLIVKMSRYTKDGFFIKSSDWKIDSIVKVPDNTVEGR